jgi:DUF438 domain-containing protein
MLTTTYSLVAINLEQKNAYKMLSRLEQDIDLRKKNAKQNGTNNTDASAEYLKYILSEFTQIENYFRCRKMEMYVIPAIRKATENIDAVLTELEFLDDLENAAIRTVIEQIQWAIDNQSVQPDLLLSAMEQYCQSLLKRLVKEDEQLLPVARNVLTGDEWFNIAVECMDSDTKNNVSKPSEKITARFNLDRLPEKLSALSN